MGVITGLVDIDITEPLPETGEPGGTYVIKGNAKGFDVIGAPPWVYAQVWKKEWYAPEAIEKFTSQSFERGFPIPITGDFSVDWTPEKDGEYEVQLLATPAPLALPVVGIFPITGESEKMHISIGALPEEERIESFKIISYAKNGGTPVIPPNVLELKVGDKCRVKVGGNHKGAAIGGTLHVAIWQPGGALNPVDEVLAVNKANSIPASTDWKPFETTVDITITTAAKAGAEYDIYAAIRGITGGDVYTETDFDSLIKIAGVPSEGKVSNVAVTYYDAEAQMGGKCKVTVAFNYIGPKANKTIRAAIGHQYYGVFPWFNEKVYTTKTVTLDASDVQVGYEADLEVPITSGNIAADESPFDLYAKVDGAMSPLYEDIITITEAPVVYKGSIIGQWVNKAPEGNGLPFGYGIDLRVTADGNTFEVGVKYKNLTGITVYGGCKVTVIDPQNVTRATPAVDWTGMGNNEELPTEYNICGVDKTGVWYIDIAFLMNKDSPSETNAKIVTRYSGQLFVATPVSAQYKGLIVHPSMYKATEGEIEFPATVKANNEYFKVFIDCKNTSTVTYTAGVELKVYDPTGTLRASPTIDWTGIAPNQELEWEYNKTRGLACTVDKVGSWEIKVRFLEKSTSTVLDEKNLTMMATSVIPGKQPPTIETLAEQNVTHDSATLYSKLVSKGYDTQVYWYFEWGKSTAYGNKTPKTFYAGPVGATFHVELQHYLEPNTIYHFRAVCESANVDPVLVGYGADRSFTTKAGVVAGFTMKSINPPIPATQWIAGTPGTGMDYPNMSGPQPFTYTWAWAKAVPGYIMELFIMALGPAEPDGFSPAIKSDQFPFLLRDGKNYAYDWSRPDPPSNRMVEI